MFLSANRYHPRESSPGQAFAGTCARMKSHELDRPTPPTAMAAHSTRRSGAGATVEPQLFREAMSRLGAAVHVVTTGGSGRQDGFQRDRGVLGLGCAADRAGLPQPQEPGRPADARERRVLRQHARRRG